MCSTVFILNFIKRFINAVSEAGCRFSFLFHMPELSTLSFRNGLHPSYQFGLESPAAFGKTTMF
jgi:hypothetical protein